MRSKIDGILTDKSVDFIKQHAKGDKPFFLYIPFSLPHAPALPGKAFQNSSRNNYQNVLTEIDHHTGRILDAINEAAFQSVQVYDVVSDNWKDTVYNKAYNSIGAPVFRWRRAQLNDFKARMDWCVKEYSNANHNPLISLLGGTTEAIMYINGQPDQEVILDASASTDPDGDPLTFRWYNYTEVTTYKGEISISYPEKRKAIIKIPPDAANEQIHIILEVTDRNEITNLTSYRRIIIDVDSASSQKGVY